VTDGQTVGQTESIMAKTALCIASYADALSMNDKVIGLKKNCRRHLTFANDNDILSVS